MLGVTNGPLRIGNVVRALLALGGQGTSNLRVALAIDFPAGARHYWQGELSDTGLDVPKGAFAPLGCPFAFAMADCVLASVAHFAI